MKKNKIRVSGWIEEKLLPIANKFAMQRHLKAIQCSFLIAIPIMMVGSFALILESPPVDYTTLPSSNVFYGLLKVWSEFAEFAMPGLDMLFYATMGCLSVYIALAGTFYLSRHYKQDPIMPMITTFVVFLMMNANFEEGIIYSTYFDGTGLFAAIIVAFTTTELYHFLVSRGFAKVKMPMGVPQALADSFTALFPVILICIVYMLLSCFFLNVIEKPFPEFILTCMQPLVHYIDNVFGVAFLSVLTQVFWWFGIHNSAISAITDPFLTFNYTSNAAAFANGVAATDLPHILTDQLWWVFMTIGGSGATFSLAVMLLRTKSKQLRGVGKLAIIPAFFNINEPIIFGLPIVLNPVFLFPFVFAMTFNGVATYLVMDFGIIAKSFADPGWNLFAPIAAFIATLDWKAVVWVIILIVIDGLIYYPFLKAYDHSLYSEEKKDEELYEASLEMNREKGNS